jgi:4-hydroxy-tetrahydrodipicolinate synthase
MATPFDSSGAVDERAIVKQIELYRRVGAAGVVALGVFGEAAKLDSQEKRNVVRAVTASCDDLPVVVGLSGRATAPAVEEASTIVSAARRDLAGLMVQVHSSHPEVVAAHLTRVSDATGAGIVVQDYPLVSGVHISADDLATAIAACDCAIAIKAEAPPTPPAIATLAARTQLPVFGGLGGVGLIDELAAGAAGAMTGFSYPEGLVATVDAWFEGGFEAALETWSPWLPLANFEAQAGIGLALRKEILYRRGLLGSGTIRTPGTEIPKQLLPLLELHLAHVTKRGR